MVDLIGGVVVMVMNVMCEFGFGECEGGDDEESKRRRVRRRKKEK